MYVGHRHICFYLSNGDTVAHWNPNPNEDKRKEISFRETLKRNFSNPPEILKITIERW